MLNLAITLLLIALLFGVLGYTGVAVQFASIAQILFVVFIVLFLISAVARRPPV
jgi:uncharacterized membrane protein YtjA (UPF0391 family)